MATNITNEIICQKTLDLAPIGIGLGTLNGCVISANQTLQKMLGYSLDELKKINIAETYARPGEREVLKNKLGESGHIENYEVELKRRDGSTYFALVNVDLIEWNGQKVILNTQRDITELKNLEKVLIENEERYRMLFETAALGIVYHDADGKIISVNPAARGILGFSSDFLEGKTCEKPQWDTIREDGTEFSPEDRPVIKALKEGKAVNGVVMGVFNPQKKRYVWINVNAVPLFRPLEKKPWQVYVVFEDITEKKEKSDELKRSELMKMQLIESAHEGYCTVNLNKKITFVNKRLCEMSGYSKEELIGEEMLNFFDSEHQKTVLFMFEKCLGGENCSFNTEIIHKEGHRIFTTITASATTDENGNINGVFALINDFTKQKVLENEIISVRHELVEKYSFNDIIGRSEALRTIFETLPAIADIDCNILLEGASGTGKNLFAKVIHNISGRKDGPFVVVNCGTLPENLLESELFGYLRGAFTGADRDKPGKFAAAEGGILFLDEIGELPLNLQVKLLRVIEEKQYEPLGSNKTAKSDTRIIAATNRDLKAMVEDGKFRTDLYFRLKIVSIKIPALKERPDDIDVLTEHFIEHFNKKYNKNIDCVSNELSRFLKLYDFPGNIRELKNMIEHAFIFCNSEILQLQHIAYEYKPIVEKLFNKNINNEIVLHRQKPDRDDIVKKREAHIDEGEKKLIIETIEKCGNNKSAAARSLNMSYVTLWRKMKKYDLGRHLESGPEKGDFFRSNGQDHAAEATGGEEKEILKKALEKTGNNKTKAAGDLNIDRTTLWRKLKKYGLI